MFNIWKMLGVAGRSQFQKGLTGYLNEAPWFKRMVFQTQTATISGTQGRIQRILQFAKEEVKNDMKRK